MLKLRLAVGLVLFLWPSPSFAQLQQGTIVGTNRRPQRCGYR